MVTDPWQLALLAGGAPLVSLEQPAPIGSAGEQARIAFLSRSSRHDRGLRTVLCNGQRASFIPEFETKTSSLKVREKIHASVLPQDGPCKQVALLIAEISLNSNIFNSI